MRAGFAEDRHDLRIDRASGGAVEIVRTASAGAVTTLADGESHRSIAAVPDPAVLPPDAALGTLARLDEQLRIRSPEGTTFAVRWVEHLQHVVTLRGSEKHRETRAGRRVRLEMRLTDGTRRAAAVADAVLRPGRDLEIDSFVHGAVGRLIARLSAVPAPPGDQCVVFAPGVAGLLAHELIGHALEGDTVCGGGSRLARERPRFACGDLRVIDDPRRARVPWRLDDEGEAAVPVALVDAGQTVGALLDRGSAEALGRRPTGHGRRSSYLDAVRPRMGCTFVAAGRLDAREILESVQRGVYVRRMDAAAVDAEAGEATFRVVDGDAIENGRIVQALDPFLLIVTLHDVVQGIDLIGRDLEFDTCVGSCIRYGQPLSTSVGAPTIRLRSARIVS